MRQKFNKYKVIFHDQMYNKQEKLICVFTQERALRFLRENKGLYFDKLYIDEAHKLFNKDDRSILLARLIRINGALNKEQQVLYLSPLIKESKNLMIDGVMIQEQKIDFNIKDYDINYVSKDLECYKYNKYLRKTILINNNEDSIYSYIENNKKNKNFIFLNTPQKIEEFSLNFSGKLNEKNNNYINDIIEIIVRYVHEDYYMVEPLRKGIIYLHGKVPDLIKDFLEYKFKESDDLTYLVANTVILEGVNFPFDNLFIVVTRGLKRKSLENLIGRVNRLNDIFDKNKGTLEKLIVPIHFVDNDKYSPDNMGNKLKLFLDPIKDEVENPLLENTKNIVSDVKITENKIIDNLVNNVDNFEQILLLSGLNLIYDNFADAVHKIKINISFYNEKLFKEEFDLLDIIYQIFIRGFEYKDFKNKEFERLSNYEARKFYGLYLSTYYNKSLKVKIEMFIYYFNLKSKSEDPFLYVGRSYGEVPKKTKAYEGKNHVYVDLKSKNHIELVNIAVIKIDIEDDFVAFYLERFAKILLELDIIDEEQYNHVFYSSNDSRVIEMRRSGLSRNLINKLIEDELIEEIIVKNNGELLFSKKFIEYLNNQDELFKFEFYRINGKID